MPKNGEETKAQAMARDVAEALGLEVKFDVNVPADRFVIRVGDDFGGLGVFAGGKAPDGGSEAGSCDPGSSEGVLGVDWAVPEKDVSAMRYYEAGTYSRDDAGEGLPNWKFNGQPSARVSDAQEVVSELLRERDEWRGRAFENMEKAEELRRLLVVNEGEIAQLYERLEKVEAHNKQLAEQNQNAVRTIHEAQLENRRLAGKRGPYRTGNRTDLERLREDKAALLENLKGAHERREKAESERDMHLNDYRGMRDAYNRLESQYGYLEQQVNAQAGTIRQQTSSKDYLNRKLEEEERRRRDLERRVREQDAALENLRAGRGEGRAELQARIEELESQHVEDLACTELTPFGDGTVHAYNAAYQELAVIPQEMVEGVQKVAPARSDLQDEIEELRAKLKEADRENVRLAKDLKLADAWFETAKLREQLEAADRLLAESRERSGRLARRKDELEAELAKERAKPGPGEAAQLLEELTSEREQLKRVTAELGRKGEELDRLSGSVEHYLNLLYAANKETERLGSENAYLRKINGRRAARCRRYAKQADDLKRRLKEYEGAEVIAFDTGVAPGSLRIGQPYRGGVTNEGARKITEDLLREYRKTYGYPSILGKILP